MTWVSLRNWQITGSLLVGRLYATIDCNVDKSIKNSPAQPDGGEVVNEFRARTGPARLAGAIHAQKWIFPRAYESDPLAGQSKVVRSQFPLSVRLLCVDDNHVIIPGSRHNAKLSESPAFDASLNHCLIWRV